MSSRTATRFWSASGACTSSYWGGSQSGQPARPRSGTGSLVQTPALFLGSRKVSPSGAIWEGRTFHISPAAVIHLMHLYIKKSGTLTLPAFDALTINVLCCNFLTWVQRWKTSRSANRKAETYSISQVGKYGSIPVLRSQIKAGSGRSFSSIIRKERALASNCRIPMYPAQTQ
jgi:hypothetical protein